MQNLYQLDVYPKVQLEAVAAQKAATKVLHFIPVRMLNKLTFPLLECDRLKLKHSSANHYFASIKATFFNNQLGVKTT